jgi:hypothetical protein
VDDIRRYVRYQNYAEALRLIATAKQDDPMQGTLFAKADSYDLMARSVQGIIETKLALGKTDI